MTSDKENNTAKDGKELHGGIMPLPIPSPNRATQCTTKPVNLLFEDIKSHLPIPAMISEPDFEQMRHDRLDRNKKVMAKISPSIKGNETKEKNGSMATYTPEQSAAICFQKYYRGHLARKLYLELLHQKFNKDEEERRMKQNEQVEEGELIIENLKLKAEITDEFVALRNRDRRMQYYVTVIQRAWRRYKKRCLLKNASKPRVLETDRFFVKEYLI